MLNYDVVVVGAGNAALAAAVSARENGASVLVLEKAPKNMRGGNTHWSGGLFRFAYGDPQSVKPLIPNAEEKHENFYEGIKPYSADDFHDDLMRVTNGRTDPVLSRVIVDNSKDTVLWMNTVGKVEMEPAISVAAVRKGNSFVWLRGLVIRAVHEGVGLSTSWFNTCEEMGVDVLYDSAVLSLEVNEAGRVCGVKVRDANGIRTISAGSVILGCGGFEANAQMRTQYIGPLLGDAKVRGTPHNQGDGLRMVPTRESDDAVCSLRIRKARERVVGATELERSHALQVLALEVELRTGARVRRPRCDDARTVGDTLQANGGLFDVSK